MRLPPPLIDLVARGVVRQLIARRVVSSDHPRATEEKVARLIAEDLKVEDALNEEARLVLDEHREALRGGEVEYHRLFTRVKSELAAQRGYVLGAGPGKLPREKVNSLGGAVAVLLLEDPDVEYFVPEPQLRLAVLRALEDEMRRDLLREEKAHQKVRSIRRNIPEESAEFHALFQQFYRDLLDREG